MKNIFDHVRAHNGDRGFTPEPPSEPSCAVPGTPEKIEVMRQRNEAGQEIHHDDDIFSYESYGQNEAKNLFLSPDKSLFSRKN